MPSHHPAKILSRIKNKSIRNRTVHESVRATMHRQQPTCLYLSQRTQNTNQPLKEW
jgi:hypothetical protein